jgi:hypothetical protein
MLRSNFRLEQLLFYRPRFQPFFGQFPTTISKLFAVSAAFDPFKAFLFSLGSIYRQLSVV